MDEESTVPDPIELTRSFYETMEREWDFDALAGFFAPDAMWDLSRSGIYDGVRAIGDFLVGYWATWEDHHHEIEGMLDFGEGVLSVAIRQDGCLKGSDARVQARHLQVFEWAQGRILWITGYPDLEEGACCRPTPRGGARVAGVAGERGGSGAHDASVQPAEHRRVR